MYKETKYNDLFVEWRFNRTVLYSSILDKHILIDLNETALVRDKFSYCLPILMQNKVDQMMQERDRTGNNYIDNDYIQLKI